MDDVRDFQNRILGCVVFWMYGPTGRIAANWEGFHVLLVIRTPIRSQRFGVRITSSTWNPSQLDFLLDGPLPSASPSFLIIIIIIIIIFIFISIIIVIKVVSKS